MAHNVTYADLRFVRTPTGSSPSSRAPEAAPDAEEDAELTYENIHLGQTVEVKRGPGAEQSHEPWWGTRHLPLGLMGACLFLLASTIGLGVRYWQVSQHLQQASQAHEAESSRLSQQVSSKGASLAQTASELEQARRELEEARRDLEQAQGKLEQARQELEQTGGQLEQERLEGNRTQERLQQLEAELRTVKKEKQEVTENLSRMKQELSSIRPCEQTEPWWGTYHLPLGLLGACLFLLASTIGLGVRYWQVSQHLQQASQAHEAESSRLSQQVSSKGASLAQTARELELAQRELEEARRDLEQERLEGNRTQERLQQLEAKLDGTTKTLATLTQEKQEVTEKLSRVKQELSSIRPCEQTGCCPEQWVLYRGKCLFISRWPMNWDESRKDCEGKSARLLVTRPWNWSTMPSFLVNTDVQYWIGLKRDWRTSLWIDDPLFEDHKESYKSCGAVQGGSLLSGTCEHSKPWICEKAPEQPSSARWPHFLQ
ncbi:B-cell differentiation antigen CD72 isoform X3 [Pelodiscus sinensis]|uniref:B-cell differentiation antigen CD72 isoform X3 n=1 Tax=Pelodiscus sinensis TaxID=13735 RepID=UPI003F6BB729